MFHRSHGDLVLDAASTYATFGLSKSIAFIGAAEIHRSDTPSFVKYELGDIEVTSLIDGFTEAPHQDVPIRNATVRQAKDALRAVGLSESHVPIPFTAMAVY